MPVDLFRPAHGWDSTHDGMCLAATMARMRGKEYPIMNAQDLTALGNKVSSFISQLDMDDIRDGLLARAHLRRRRPILMSLSAVGLIGLGAVAAFAAVAFVPSVRKIFIGGGEKLAASATKGKDELLRSAEEMKDSVKRAVQPNGPRAAGQG
jgi:hypothetical protein